MNMKLFVLVVLASIASIARSKSLTDKGKEDPPTPANNVTDFDIPILRTSCATQCDIEPTKRHECGGIDVTKDTCLQSGCCYDDDAENDDVIQCYHKDISLCDQPECSSVLPEYRVECEVPEGFKDYAHIIMKDSMYCSSMPDCCWDESIEENSMYPRCFQKGERQESVQVMVATQTKCLAIPEENRKECGHARMTERECLQKSCCWKPVNDYDTPWCYHNTNEETENTKTSNIIPQQVYGITENIASDNRPTSAVKCGKLDYTKPCGGKKMTYNECKNKGCCWAESNIETYQCFKAVIEAPVATQRTPVAETLPVSPVSVNPSPTDVYGKVLRGENATPVNVDQSASPYGNINQIQQNQTPLSTNVPIQQTVNPMSSMAQIMIFCGKKKGNLCKMAIMSMLGGNKINPASKVPTMPDYLNYVLRRGAYKAETTNSGARTTLSDNGRIKFRPALTGDKHQDEMCFNTTEFKQYSKFYAPCGGLHTPTPIKNQEECIIAGCCWVDDYKSLMRKVYKLDEQGSSALISAIMSPILGLDNADSINCIEALSHSQIKQIGRMAMIQSPTTTGSAFGGVAPELLTVLMDDSEVSPIMMAAVMGGGGMSFPLALALTENEDDSKIILPLIMEMMQQTQETTLHHSPAQGETKTNGNNLMSILPLYLAMGKNKDMSAIAPFLLSQMNGGSGMMDPTVLSLLLNGDEDESTGESGLPLSLILSMAQSQGQQGQQGAAPAIDPMFLMTMMKDGDDKSALIPILMNAMKASSAPQSQVWSSSGQAEPTGQANQANYPGTTGQTQSQQNPATPINPFLLASILGGEGSSSLKDMIPFILMQNQQGGGSATGLESILPYLLSDESGSDNMMLMQVLSNPEMMKNPNQLMPILLSQMGSGEGDSDNTMNMVMAMAMSQQATQGQGQQGQRPDMMSMMMPILLANQNKKDNDSKSNITPIIMQMAMAGGDPQSTQALLPILLSGGNMDPTTIQMMMNPSMMTGNNPALSLILLNNQGSEKSIDPVLMNMLMNPQTGNGAGSSLATALLLAKQGSASSEDGTIDPAILQMMMMNPASNNPTQSYSPTQTGTTGYNPGSTQPNPLLSILLPSLLNQDDDSASSNGMLTQLLLAQAQSGSNGAASPFGMAQLLPSLLGSSEGGMDEALIMSLLTSQPFNQPGLGGTSAYQPLNPFALPAMNTNTNRVPYGFTGYLTEGNDGEHSTQPEVSEECNFPPGAEKEICDVTAATEKECATAKCCWDSGAEADIKCYKST